MNDNEILRTIFFDHWGQGEGVYFVEIEENLLRK